MGENEVVIILPLFNEESRFQIEVFYSFFHKTQFSFCFVNDGSTDGTSDILHSILKNNENRIHLIDRKENKGKAESVREGCLLMSKTGRFKQIAFFDADFATPLSEIYPMLQIMQDKGVDMVIGSRFKRLGADIRRNKKRFLIGRVFATIASVLLGLAVYDTQCGAKVFDQRVVSDLYNEKFESSWLFDIEILFRLIDLRGEKDVKNRIVEYPLNAWREVAGSKLKMSDFLVLPWMLFRLYFIYKR